MIVFHALFHVDPDVSMKRKLIFANRMSRELILLNVCLLDKVSLLAKYQIPYSGGFSPRFLVNALRRFVELTKYVAREVDRRGLNSGKS